MFLGPGTAVHSAVDQASSSRDSGGRKSASCRRTPLCVRHEPAGAVAGGGDALDRHTLAWVDRVNRSGAAYLTPAVLDGRWMARVSIGAEATERSHVEALWNTMQMEAEGESGKSED